MKGIQLMPPRNPAAAQEEARLLERIGKGDRAAFEKVIARHHLEIESSIYRRLGPIPNRSESARDIVEDLWFDLLQKPERLRNHDPYQRPLVCFLTVLAARAVATHFRKLRTQLPVVSPEDWQMPQAPDTAADLDALADRWQEVVRVLDKEELAFLLRMQRKRKRKQAKQKRYERIIHKLRRHFGLA